MDNIQASAAMKTLIHDFPNAVLKPGTSHYDKENSKFWNQDNADIRPSAIVTPSSAQETAYVPLDLPLTNVRGN